jgi:hypothetical protein
MPAEPLFDTQRQYLELTDEFIEGIARKFFTILPTTMTSQQRDAAINSMAAFIRDVDALIARVDLVDTIIQTANASDLVRNRLRALRNVAWVAMQELNPDQAWYWTEKWQAGEREADRDLAAGRLTHYASDEEFDAALDALDAEAEAETR